MGRCPHGRGAHSALIGRSDEGVFNTARAKIYPPGLNKELADGMVDFAIALGTEGRAAALPEVFATIYSQQLLDDCTVQPDYHG